MGIHIKLKDRRTFLLGGAFLLFLLLFAMMSCVSAADSISNTSIVNNSSIANNSLEDKYTPDFDNITNNDVMNQNKVNMIYNSTTKVELSNIKADTITIKNNENHVFLRDITCDVLIVEDSAISYINIYNSNINKVLIKHTTVSSLFFRSYIVGTTIKSLIIEDSNLKDQLEIKYSNIWNITFIDSYIDTMHISDHSKLMFGESLNSQIKNVAIIDYSKVAFGNSSLNSVSSLTHDAHSYTLTLGSYVFFLTTDDVNTTPERAFCSFFGFILVTTPFVVVGAFLGVDIAGGLYDYVFIALNAYRYYDFESGFYHWTMRIPQINPLGGFNAFRAACGFAGAVTAVAGAIAGAIAGEKIGEKAAEYVLDDDIFEFDDTFEGHEKAVGGVTGAIAGGVAGTIAGTIAGALAGALLGFCIGGPAGAIAFGITGGKTGANVGFFTGLMSGWFAGEKKGEEIAKKRASNN